MQSSLFAFMFVFLQLSMTELWDRLCTQQGSASNKCLSYQTPS